MFRTITIVVALALAATSALAQNADFTLVNATGYPITEVYVSPTKLQSWGTDVLGKHVVGNGDAWKLTFPSSTEHCVQDMPIVFEDDSSKVSREELNLCEIDKITLTYNRQTGVTSAKKSSVLRTTID